MSAKVVSANVAKTESTPTGMVIQALGLAGPAKREEEEEEYLPVLRSSARRKMEVVEKWSTTA